MAVYKDEKNNTWLVKTVYKDFTGKRKYITRRGFKTKREAKEAEAMILLSKKDNNIVNSSITFEELYKEYNEYISLRVKESTLITNDNQVQLHIMPYFKSKKITDITVKDIQAWQEVLLKNKKNYSLRYLRNLHIRFSAVMRYGVQQGYLMNNVLEKQGNFEKDDHIKKEMEFFTYEEWQKFESVLKEDVYKLLFQFLYYTGARIGEALSLTFNDFDEGFTEVNINKTITTKTKKTGINITSTKTRDSVRTILLPDVLIKEMNKHFNDCISISGFSRNDYVFGISKPISTTNIERRKNKACEQAKLKKIRIHDFRHSHASFLINNGVEPIVISKRLGHSSVRTTLEVYSHMFEKQNRKAIDVINKLTKKI